MKYFQNREKKSKKLCCPFLNLDGVGKIHPWTQDEESSEDDERKNYLI